MISNNYNKSQDKQQTDIKEALQRTLKTAQVPSLYNRSYRLLQPSTIRIAKEYLYGLHFAGLTYSLYGWLARVELHLVK